MKSILSACFLTCACVVVSIIPKMVWAQDLTCEPVIGISGEYNDNVLFTRTDKGEEKRDDYIGSTGVGLRVNYATELLRIRSNGKVSLSRYTDNTFLNDEYYFYGFNTSYRFTERSTLSGKFMFVKDTTLESGPEESEIEETDHYVYFRTNRRQYNARIGFLHKISEISEMVFKYNYAKKDYDYEENIDSDSQYVSCLYRRRLKTRKDDIFVRLSYSHNSYGRSYNNYELSFGWGHGFSETLGIRVLLGGRYTTQDVNGQEARNENWAGTADIRIEKTGENASAIFGYRRDLRSSVDSSAINVDKLYCNLDYSLTERLGMRFDTSLYLTKSESDTSDEDRRFFEIMPWLNYQVFENCFVKIAYSYTMDHDKTGHDDQKSERNRFWIILTMGFPGEW